MLKIGSEGTTDNHYSQDLLIKFLNGHEAVFPNMTSLQPLHNALLIFSDSSSKGRAGYLINNQEEVDIEIPGFSAHLAELTAVFNL